MGYQKDPRKFCKQRFEQYGAVVHGSEKTGVQFVFPDGAFVFVRHDIPMHVATSLVRETTARYSSQKNWGITGRRRSNHPTVDFDRLTASGHAIERLHQMQAQATLEYRELLYALRTPLRVLYSDAHESWVWIGERVALPLSFAADGTATIRTVLWAKDELWQENPRPERR